MLRQFDKIQQGLKREIIDTLAFTDPLLSLRSVANRIGSNEKYLSRYMKMVEHCNFSTYINQLRIRYSADLLLKDKTINIAAISQSAGFNSPGIFHRCFRQIYHQTPSVYRQTCGNAIDKKLENDDPIISEFSRRLKAKYPRLSDKEIHHCFLIYQGYDGKAQAEALGITYGSLLVTRSRIREKLSMTRSDHLDILIKEAVHYL